MGNDSGLSKNYILKGVSRDSVLENFGESLLIIDPEFRIVYFNKRAEEITEGSKYRLGRKHE